MMNAKYLIAIGAAALTSLASQALTVDSTAGKLSDAVGSDVAATSLTVNGSVDASDFDFIRDKMTSLSSLDLSGATISAYEGVVLENGRKQEPANALPAYALLSTKISSITLPASLKTIEEGALGNTAITSVAIPDGVTEIGDGAFSNTPLEAIVLPASVTTLGTGVFKDCTSLTSAQLDATSLTALPSSSFQLCSKLTNVTLPAGVTSIGSSAFSGCSSLAGLTLPASIESIGEKAFASSGLQKVDFSGCTALKSVGAWSYVSCPALQAVVFTPSVDTLGEGAFYHDSGAALELAVLAQSAVTEIPAYAFTNVAHGETEGFGDSRITSVGDYALAGWDASTITLPSTLEYLGDEAMANWKNLTMVNAEDLTAVPSLGTDVWSGVNQADAVLRVSGSTKEDFESADQWREFIVQANQSTNISSAVADESKVAASFSGTDLMITASEQILRVDLYDIQGRALAAVTPSSPNAAIDTSAFDARVYIVRVALADHSRATFKLAR